MNPRLLSLLAFAGTTAISTFLSSCGELDAGGDHFVMEGPLPRRATQYFSLPSACREIRSFLIGNAAEGGIPGKFYVACLGGLYVCNPEEGCYLQAPFETENPGIPVSQFFWPPHGQVVTFAHETGIHNGYVIFDTSEENQREPIAIPLLNNPTLGERASPLSAIWSIVPGLGDHFYMGATQIYDGEEQSVVVELQDSILSPEWLFMRGTIVSGRPALSFVNGGLLSLHPGKEGISGLAAVHFNPADNFPTSSLNFSAAYFPTRHAMVRTVDGRATSLFGITTAEPPELAEIPTPDSGGSFDDIRKISLSGLRSATGIAYDRSREVVYVADRIGQVARANIQNGSSVLFGTENQNRIPRNLTETRWSNGSLYFAASTGDDKDDKRDPEILRAVVDENHPCPEPGQSCE